MRAFLTLLIVAIASTGRCFAFLGGGGSKERAPRHVIGRTASAVYQRRNLETASPLLVLHAAATNEGVLTVERGSEECELAYRVVRPMSLSSRQAAPIVVLHGGPSVPSDYLYPLEQHVPYRSIVFYDQIGCGRSSEPTDPALYSIDAAIDDLEALLRKLGVRRFHLYGQSFGGILAFEYMKRIAEREKEPEFICLSAVLSSTPTSVAMVEKEAERLVAALDDSNENADVSILAAEDAAFVVEQFRLQHQCRTPEPPDALKDAYAHAGTTWRGTTAIPDYEAQPVAENAPRRMPSCMVMHGEHDYITDKCVAGWKDCFSHKFVRTKTLEGCSHHGLLENGPLYGEKINSYFGEHD